MKLFCTVFFSLLLFSSCLEVNKRSYLSEIDTLLLDIDSMKTQAETLSIDTVDSLRKLRCDLLSAYKNDNPSDTITIETAQHIENLKFSCSNLKAFLDQKETLNQIEMYRNELLQLQKLINKGEGERSSYNELIAEEKQNIQVLKSNFEQIQRYYQNGIRNFGVSEEYLKSLMNLE
ncbi:MAG TPA: hypothetical protein PLP27_06400 [Crocinitomicaceae bacterium]|nr:hypothetical protein [Crocinitomicaceae bacterium]